MKKPIWEPSPERIERANLQRFARFAREQCGNDDLRGYAPLYDFSIRHPERFWPLVWEFCGIRASGTFHEVLVDAERLPGARWFPGMRLNFAQNLLRFRDERCAIAGRDAAGTWQELSYAELQQQVTLVAAAWRADGLRAGDSVCGVLPNRIEAVVAMLASVALGAVWSAVPAGGDAAATRAAVAAFAPQLIVADVAQQITLQDLCAPQRLIVVGAPPAQAQSWSALLAHPAAPLTFELNGFEHPLYALRQNDGEITLHSAGGTLIQHLKELVLQVDLKREDRILHNGAPGSVLWHWLTTALAAGSTLVLADADFDLAQGAAWDLLDEQAISVLATDTTQLAALQASALMPRDRHKLLTLKTVLATGTPPSADCVEQVYARVKDRLMLSLCGGDAGGLGFLALGCPVLPVYADELQCRGLGMKVEVLDAAGIALREQPGTLTCLAPFPGLPLGLCGDTDGRRFQARYFSHRANAWSCGEQAVLTAHEGIQLTRADAHRAAP